MGFGYILMRGAPAAARAIRRLNDSPVATVPTPEQTYDALAPDLKRQVDANRAARLERETMTNQQHRAQVCKFCLCTTASHLQAQLNDPDAQKPVWSGPSRS